MFIYPDDDLTIVMLTDLMGGSPQTFVDRIAAFYIPGFRRRSKKNPWSLLAQVAA